MFLAFFLSLVNFRVAKLDVSHMTFLFFLSFFLIKLNDTLYFYCHLKNKVLHEGKQTFFFLKKPNFISIKQQWRQRGWGWNLTNEQLQLKDLDIKKQKPILGNKVKETKKGEKSHLKPNFKYFINNVYPDHRLKSFLSLFVILDVCHWLHPGSQTQMYPSLIPASLKHNFKNRKLP